MDTTEIERAVVNYQATAVMFGLAGFPATATFYREQAEELRGRLAAREIGHHRAALIKRIDVYA